MVHKYTVQPGGVSLDCGQLGRGIGEGFQKCCKYYTPGFFLTSVAEKTKTQAQNSSTKLKEKTQPQGGTFLLLRKTQETNSIFPKNV